MAKHVTIDDLKGQIGQEIGVSKWFEISQGTIDAFADITLDHQFIHIDPVKAKQTPFGGTIAHGFLTVSMFSAFAIDALPEIAGRAMGVNYGFDKLRMVSPVRSGARVRGRFTLKALESKNPKQHQLTYGVTVEVDGSDKPAVVADWVTLTYLA
ncbi:MaoC family dehydratase [Phreatobacter sp. AB_2022a]|uniref:MaoC family dehydratase n=1 Tax=Phreatobacter sp. AB_2022a TaxID=3003134 RepID=UPI00057141A0|nr:MaoC family dehydratase [Phreatobacter sp. AB_2022a]MCZ0735733.1 MaoC family dehydratase [Phreatobacter sp. AB_2022a]CEJ15719.1 putative enoyl-CoA hydratase 1 [bacterium YEK0313]